jgi:eukaryotic-like serine/threonine-protein kinase
MKHCPVCDTEYPDEHTTCPGDGAVLLESQELAPGAVVRGKYRILGKLGQGGMGIVYLAEHLLLGGQAALKFLAAELSRDPRVLRRFRMEARATYQLRHPNIVEVTDLDQSEDGSLFIAMEYVAGESLRSAIDGHSGGLPTEQALGITRGIAAGLGAAHGRGLVHRDVKPENILIAGDGTPKILDFGIVAMAEEVAGRSRTRGLMLTPEYAAPEQWRGVPAPELDGRTDLYALGGVLFEMLTGQTAFHAHNNEGWMYQHLRETPPPPSSVNQELAEWPGLDAMVLRLLAREREQRTASVQEFLPELARVLEARAARERTGEHRAQADTATVRESPRAEQPVERPAEKKPEFPDRPAVRTDPPPPPPPPGRSGLKPLLIAIVVVVAVLGLVLLGVLANGRKTPVPESAAQQPAAQSPNPAPASPAPVEAPVVQAPPSESPQRAARTTPRPVSPPETEATPSPSPGAEYTQGLSLYHQQRYAEARDAYQKACNGGDPRGCHDLGWLYQKGFGVTADYLQARRLYGTSCAMKDMDGCYDLGWIYQNGLGVSQDFVQAGTLYQKACDGGNVKACYSMGWLYEYAKGVNQDYGQARSLFEKACNGGSLEGCCELGYLYQNGQGTNRDYGQALSLYQRACNGGNMVACNNIGWLYQNGLGVTQDYEQARVMYQKACTGGYDTACETLRKLPASQ